jgi:hypothetical protein
MSSQFEVQISCVNYELLKDSDLIKKCSEHSKPAFVSQSEWGVCIDPKSDHFSLAEKKDFGFVPLMSFSLSLEQVNIALGISVANPDQLLSQLQGKFPELKFALLEEEMDCYRILVNSEIPQEQRNSQDSIEALLISIIKSFSSEVQTNYAKYFVSNCLIVNGAPPFEGYSKSTQQVRTIVNDYISNNVEVKSVEKTKAQQYDDSFDFRPFFGPGLLKLPVCDRAGQLSGDVAKWNWDDLYINSGFDGERFEKNT